MRGMVLIYYTSFFYTFVANHLIMAKKKTTKKVFKETVENKAEKVVQETKQVPYNGYISMGGARIKMSEAKARLLVKQGKAKFD
jgi:hypothetical protein